MYTYFITQPLNKERYMIISQIFYKYKDKLLMNQELSWYAIREYVL